MIKRFRKLYGKLTLLSKIEDSKKLYKAKCKCGRVIVVNIDNVKKVKRASCGCLTRTKGETSIFNFLLSNNIEFELEKSFPDLRSKKDGRLRFDFFIEKLNLVIEYDGEQHYKPIRNNSYGNMMLQMIQDNDEIKNKYCKEKGWRMLRIPYWKKTVITKILSEELNITVND